MPRLLRVAAAQVGRIDRGTPRAQVIARLIALLEEAAAKSVKLVVFPETTFTTFFPRYLITDGKELDSYFEVEDAETGIANSANVKPFFDKAAELGVDVVIGYGEKTPEGTSYNTASYVSGGRVISKYRKVHLPGSFDPFNDHPDTTNQLEKRYFKPGNLGFQAFRAPALRHETRSPIIGMLICNDRRWAEGWRCYGLQGVEIMCIGYNTVAWAPELWGADPNMDRNDAREDALFHHKLVCQSNAYMNATFCITAARCGLDDGKFELITGSMIVDPEGYIVAENKTDTDELIIADIDLDACQQGKTRTFAFAKHRRPEHYGAIVERTGVVEPPEVV
ncbi:carbon-nitrogen hydrolase [Armillaria solidipes]|uniref:Carbon-nitrogen hydrolase n=1 Tax=Armillaria solidipes TaxID=1076256 RepID=A0A2H3B9P0_9AGAR|nr:carbon-nitrogen hydrolase [Armillaria solidipes]